MKPAGMAAELTTDREGVSLLARVARQEGHPVHLVHRLDRPTRGILLVALDPAAAAFHGRSFAERRVRKFYLARIARSAGILGDHRAFLREHRGSAEVVRSGGRPSFLSVLAVCPAPGRRGEHHALVRLDTGRRHQLRVMLAAVGAPLVGDARYGGPAGTFYLEHALFAFPSCPAGEPRVIFEASDPDREVLHPDLSGMLADLAAGPLLDG